MEDGDVGATTEALSLLQSTRSDTVDTGYGKHLVPLATMLQRVPAALGDKREDQLHIFYGAEQAKFSTCPANTSPAGPDDERRRLAYQRRDLDWRDPAIELLAGFGRVDFDLPDEFLRDPSRWWECDWCLCRFLGRARQCRREYLHHDVAQPFRLGGTLWTIAACI